MRHKNDAAAASGFSPEVPNTVAEFLKAGGKRFRPLLCMLGWHATRSTGSVAQAVQVGAALETFHASCLIHDDLMDHSDTRRGQPAVHRALATRYRPDRTAAEDLGASVAIRPRTRQTGTARQFPRLVCRSR
jgi:geranylgeranyl diphosphate synthase type I